MVIFILYIEFTPDNRGVIMPEVSRFYGIVIKLFFSGNPPAHFYAIHNEHVGMFDIATGHMVEGDLSELSCSMIKAWADLHKQPLNKMWLREQIEPLPPLQ